MTVLDPVLNYLMTCQSKKVTLAQIMEGAERPRKPVLRVLDKLTREGFLKEVNDNPIHPTLGECGPPRRNPSWRIIGDLTGRPQINPPREQSMRCKLWKLIRAKRHFTKHDLVITSGATVCSVDEYVRQLEKERYIRRTGKDGRRVTYMVIRNQVEMPVGLFGEKP